MRSWREEGGESKDFMGLVREEEKLKKTKENFELIRNEAKPVLKKHGKETNGLK